MRRVLCLVVLASCAARAPAVERAHEPLPLVPIASVTPAPVVPARAADPTLIVPCLPTSQAAILTKRELDALGVRVNALGANDSPTPLVRELQALLERPCLALAREDGDVPLTFASALSLRTWWSDGGGEWLARHLAIESVPGRAVVGTSPTPRATLTIDTARPSDPLRPLLCPARAVDDHSCGTETAGWSLRAERARQQTTDAGDRGHYCAEVMRADASGASPYAAFRACLNDGAGKDVLPLGVYQAPKDGWFIVAHSVFISIAGCQERVAVYDLATGAAYMVGCRPSPPARLAIGRVPLGALREAAWMSMLQHTAENVRTSAQWFDVPTEVAIARRVGEKVPSRRVVINTSDAPSEDWAWLRGGSGGNALLGQASGRFDTSSSSLAAHAAELLRVVDAAFEEGCAPAPVPRALPWNNLGPVVTPGVRPDVGGLFLHVDRTKTMFANAPRKSAPCATVP